MHRKPVATSPITFTQRGNEHPSMNTEASVISLIKWSTATIPKIVPEIRKPRFLDFITDNLYTKIK
jgi:hypothetical protein